VSVEYARCSRASGRMGQAFNVRIPRTPICRPALPLHPSAMFPPPFTASVAMQTDAARRVRQQSRAMTHERPARGHERQCDLLPQDIPGSHAGLFHCHPVCFFHGLSGRRQRSISSPIHSRARTFRSPSTGSSTPRSAGSRRWSWFPTALEIQINHSDDNLMVAVGAVDTDASSQVASYLIDDDVSGALYPSANVEMLLRKSPKGRVLTYRRKHSPYVSVFAAPATNTAGSILKTCQLAVY